MEERIERLLLAEGKTRVFVLADGTVIERTGGSASWRNNNPGNLKFEFAGSADKTVHTHRTRVRALQAAQRSYDGVVDLDQWGNAIFETYEAGRAAKLQLLERKYANNTVEQMLESYSRADYTGQTHHRAQAEYIHREAARQGLDLSGKVIGAMTVQEREALADGIRGFEGWKPGRSRLLPGFAAHAASRSPSGGVSGEHKAEAPVPTVQLGSGGSVVRDLQQTLSNLGYRSLDGSPLPVDGRFGPSTQAAVEAFQREHGLQPDGIVGKDTRQVLAATQAIPYVDTSHPQHALYVQALQRVHAEEDRRGVPHGRHSGNLAGALTAAAANAGLVRIDRVEFNNTGALARAVQVHPLCDEPGLNRSSAAIDTGAALAHANRHVERPRHPAAMALAEVPVAAPQTQHPSQPPSAVIARGAR